MEDDDHAIGPRCTLSCRPRGCLRWHPWSPPPPPTPGPPVDEADADLVENLGGGDPEVREAAGAYNKKGLVGCSLQCFTLFALVCPPAPARRLHHRSTQRPHPLSLPLWSLWYRMVPWTMVSLTLKRSQHRGLRLRGARFGECWATWARRWQWALTDATTPAPRAWLHRRQPVLSNGVYLRALFAAMAGMSSCSSRGSGWSSRTGQPCASGW